ncbi:unnamed protein product [Choristocarpus tenellus]
MLNGGPVTWSSKKQSTVSLSSTESESRPQLCSSRSPHLRSLLSSLGFDAKSPLILHEDNQGTIHLANNPAYSPRTKHVGVCLAFLRDTVASCIVRVVHICTKDQLADILTKNLQHVRFEDLGSSFRIFLYVFTRVLNLFP